MFPMSTKMTETLKGSHTPLILVYVKTVRGKIFWIPITSGSVSVDATSQDARRTLTFTVSDAVGDVNGLGLIPTTGLNSTWTEALQIYGNHAYVYRGVLWDKTGIDKTLFESPPIPLADDLRVPTNKAYEVVPVGVFRLNSVEIDEQTDGDIVITVTATDVSANIAMNHWIAPVTVWKTKYQAPINATDTGTEMNFVATTVVEAIKLLIINRWPTHPSKILGPPSFDFQGIDTSTELKSPVIMGSRTVSSSGSNSPWTDITGLAAAVNGTLYINVLGQFAVRPVPDPNSILPVWNLFDGDGGLLVSATRTITDQKTVNYVIATGENSGVSTPMKKIAMDNDPNSPTYWQGDFGIAVGYEPGRKKLTTPAEVQAAADTYLNWFVGGDETTTITAFVNPALDAGDVVSLRRKKVGIFDASVILAEMSGSFTEDQLKSGVSSIPVTKTVKAIPSGTKLQFFTDFITMDFIVSAAAPIGSTSIKVRSIAGGVLIPNDVYGAQTPLIDPAVASNGGVNYYIDQITIPLDLTTAMTCTMRERRVGSKQDAIRIGEYDVAGLE